MKYCATLFLSTCSAITQAWTYLVVITVVCSSEEFPLQKFGVGVYWGEGEQSVLAVRYICVRLVLSFVIKGQRYVSVLPRSHILVNKYILQVRNFVIIIFSTVLFIYS
jgi:hypothetical protein